MKKWLLGTVLTLAPVAAQAQSVTVARGETVTFTLDETGGKATPRVLDRKTTMGLSAFESAAAAKFVGGVFDGATGNNPQAMTNEEMGAIAPKAAANTVNLHFLRTPGKEASLLVITNGYDRAMVYRATMRLKDRAQATDVCLVMPGKIANEYWPYALDSIELADVKLIPWKPEDGIPCA